MSTKDNMTDKQRLQAIDAIMQKARKLLKAYVREGFSTDLREHLSLDDIKLIAKLAKEPK